MNLTKGACVECHTDTESLLVGKLKVICLKCHVEKYPCSSMKLFPELFRKKKSQQAVVEQPKDKPKRIGQARVKGGAVEVNTEGAPQFRSRRRAVA